MRSRELLVITATVALLSAQALVVVGKAVGIPAIAHYQPKEIKPEVAAGGLQKLIDRGILRLENSSSNRRAEKYIGASTKGKKYGSERRMLQTKSSKQESQAKEGLAVETVSTGHQGNHDGTSAGGKERHHHGGGGLDDGTQDGGEQPVVQGGGGQNGGTRAGGNKRHHHGDGGQDGRTQTGGQQQIQNGGGGQNGGTRAGGRGRHHHAGGGQDGGQQQIQQGGATQDGETETGKKRHHHASGGQEGETQALVLQGSDTQDGGTETGKKRHHHASGGQDGETQAIVQQGSDTQDGGTEKGKKRHHHGGGGDQTDSTRTGGQQQVQQGGGVQTGGTRAGGKHRVPDGAGGDSPDVSRAGGSGGQGDDLFYTDDGYNQPTRNPSAGDDNSFVERVVTLTAFQDNRFSSADPIFENPGDPNVEATGNLWLYVDVPLQEPLGVDVDALLGFAQGTCQGIYSNQDGYCYFTYEFFDGLEVIASLTVQGATQPTGPSILTIVGGTGELEGVSGDVSLIPASLDTTVTPPSVVEDDSAFLGNPIGYYMEAVLYIQYRLGQAPDDDGGNLFDDAVNFDDTVMTTDDTVSTTDDKTPTTDDMVSTTDDKTSTTDDMVSTTDDAMTEPTDDFVFTTVQCEGESSLCFCSNSTCAMSVCMCTAAQADACCGSGTQ